jgi:hypothetical protein
VLDWMMNLCKDLYDNRETIATGFISGAKTAANVGADVLVATPGAILDILRGVDALAMRFATWYNPPDNGLAEIMAAVRERNEEHHAMMDELAAEQGEAAGKATARTMKLQSENFNARQKVESMDAITRAKAAAGEVHAQLTEENAHLTHRLVMGEVGKGKGKGRGKGSKGKVPVKSSRNEKDSKSTIPRFPHTGTGSAGAKVGPRAGPSAGAGMELYGDSESEYDGLGKGGKRATRKRGKRSSKRGSRKTKTTRKKTTRKKRRGKK